MDISLSDEQTALRSAIDAMVSDLDRRHTEGEPFGFDDELERTTGALGLLDGDFAETGQLERVLAVESLARARGAFDSAARLGLGDLLPERRRAAVRIADDPTVRFGGTAECLVLLRPDGAQLVRTTGRTPTEIRYGFPFGQPGAGD